MGTEYKATAQFSGPSQQSSSECGVLLVDFEQIFDTLRECLFKKMLEVGIPNSKIGLWKELFRTLSVQICFTGTLRKPLKVLGAVPNLFGWSPELATLYVEVEVDVGFADGLREIQTGVVELNGGAVHLLMYADDLLVVNYSVFAWLATTIRTN